jgi:hypothetical protein
VRAGATDVVLTLDPGIDLEVRIAEWPASASDVNAELVRQDAEGLPTVHRSRVASDGGARFRGLAPDRAYTLWVPPVDGRPLLRRDVRVTRDALVVAFAPGKDITGRLVVPPGATVTSLWASADGDRFRVPGTWTKDGSYRVAGLPEGRWSIHAGARKGHEQFEGRADAPAGGSVDVALR